LKRLRFPQFILAVFLTLAAAAGLPSFAAGVEPAPAAKLKLNPEQEKKLAEIMAKAKAARIRVLDERMKKEIEDLTKITGLEPKGVISLEAAAKEAIERSATEWIADAERLVREALAQMPAQLDAMLAEGSKEMEEGANEEVPGKNLSPSEQTTWRDALKKTLNPRQLAAWEAVLAERKNILEKQFAGVMKSLEEAYRQRHGPPLDAQCARLKRLLNLSKERGEALDALAKKAIDRCVNDWIEQARKIFVASGIEQREGILKQGNVDSGSMVDSSPEQEDFWKEGLAKLFTAQELARMDSEQAERKARRTKALGQFLLAELDRVAAFSASQRERLEPIAERMAVDPVPSNLDDPAEFEASFEPFTWLAAGKKTAEEEVTPILAPEQWARWQEAMNSAGRGDNQLTFSSRDGSSLESEDLEREMSDFLFDCAAKKTKQVTAEMLLKAEDATRVAGLDEKASRRLKTAARGAAEKTLAGWRQSVDEIVHARVGKLTAQNVRKRLSGMSIATLPGVDKPSAKEAVWTEAVKAILTVDQMAAWQKAQEEREAFHQKSIAWLILTELDRKNPLAIEQWKRLEPMLIKTQADYAIELANFGDGPWYRQGYLLFIPLAAISEGELKLVLTEEQYKIWTASSDCVNSMNFVQNIQQMRAQRLNAKKP